MRPDRFREQFDAMNEGARERGRPLAYDPERFFTWEKGCLLAREGEDAEVVAATIDRLELTRRGETRNERSGIRALRFGDPFRDGDNADEDVRRVLGELPRRGGELGPYATRNHIVSVTEVNGCPNDEPEPVSTIAPAALNPGLAAARGNGSVRVLVVDTGLVAGVTETYPWLRDVVTDDELEPDFGPLAQYVGHGTFIAAVLKAVAPDAAVEVDDAIPAIMAAAVPEDVFGEALLEVLDDKGWPPILSLSAGAVTEDDRALLGLKTFMERLAQEPTVLVCSAGNNGRDEPFYPAYHAKSMPGKVIAVGALRADGQGRACFSNHGEWVTVYAPGERISSVFTAADHTPPLYVYRHSTFEECRFTHQPPYADCSCVTPRIDGERSLARDGNAAGIAATRKAFTGLARWSGTSFSTPIVAGMIVNQMLESGEDDPVVAAQHLLAKQAVAIGGGGSGTTLTPPTWRPLPYGPA